MKIKSRADDLFEKINKGLQLSFNKLVKEKAKEDGELIFSDKGKIVRVKAKQLLSELKIQ